MRATFMGFAHWVANITGSFWAFLAAVAAVAAWGLTGPAFGFSDTWQLIINTSTTIVTFLMVFLLQFDQNRNARALQVKLDELLRATRGARNAMVDAEDLSEEELEAIHQQFKRLRQR